MLNTRKAVTWMGLFVLALNGCSGGSSGGSGNDGLPPPPPAGISNVQPGDGAYLSGSFTMSADLADVLGGATVTFSIDGLTIATHTSTLSPRSVISSRDYSDGPHTLTIRTTNTAGLQSSLSRSVTFDNTAPATSFVAPATGSWHAGSVAVNTTAADNVALASVQFFLDGTAVGGSTSTSPSVTIPLGGVADGSHTVSVRATDRAGNSAEATRTITVDNTPPIVTNLTPQTTRRVTGTVTLAADIVDTQGLQTVTLSVDGAADVTVSATTRPSFDVDMTRFVSGHHVFGVTATDWNNRSVTASTALNVDNERFAFASTGSDSNFFIVAYRFHPTTAALVESGRYTGGIGGRCESIAYSEAAGRILVCVRSSLVRVFRVSETGGITFLKSMTARYGLARQPAFHQTLPIVYIVDGASTGGAVYAYSVGQDGTLSANSAATIAGVDGFDSIHITDRYLFLVSKSKKQLLVYGLSSTDGSATPLGTYALTATPSSLGSYRIAVLEEKFVYITGADIEIFSLSSTGALTGVGTVANPCGTGITLDGSAVVRSGLRSMDPAYLYTSCNPNGDRNTATYFGYRIADNGGLNLEQSLSVSGGYGYNIVADPLGYGLFNCARNVNSLRINTSNGALSAATQISVTPSQIVGDSAAFLCVTGS